MLYRVNRYCCCGCSLRTGTLVIGCCELVRDLIITLCIAFVFIHRHSHNRHWDRNWNRHYDDFWDDNWGEDWHRWHHNHSFKGSYTHSGSNRKWYSEVEWRAIFGVLLSYYVIGSIFNVTLLFGVFLKKSKLIKIYIISNISAVVLFSLTFISLVIAFGLVCETLFPHHKWGFFILCIICNGGEICLQSYNVLIVNSYRWQIKNDQGTQVPQFGSKPSQDDLQSPSKQEYDSKPPQYTLQAPSRQEYGWFSRHGKS